jgi:serine/threonine-protein kinase
VLQRERREDVDTEVWSHLWLSRLGRGLFGIAKRLTRAPAFGAAMTHRATELSIGVAAEQLFERLPRETRSALADVPELVRRLQDDARLLRVRHDEIADALASAGEASGTDAYADLRALRDEAREQLTRAVGALETVRLNLLRLHAGSVTVEGFTTQLGLAADVSAEVERIIAAREEVDRVLRFPRVIAHTPA